jgi:hypothetical protein
MDDRQPDILDSHSGTPPRRNRVAVTLAAVAIGSGALGITSIASAATNSAATTTPGATTATSTPPAPGDAPAPPPPGGIPPGNGNGNGPRGGHRPGGGPGAPGGLGRLGQALHGEYVVKKADGTYQTVDSQNGAVTAVSSTSITVKSDDGFSKSYTVDAATIVNAARDGIASVKVGDVVSLDATVAGSTATAVDVRDETTLKAAGAPWRQRPKAPPATPNPGAPNPSTTSPSATSTT